MESGNKIHSTVFEWPKNMAPSGFSMKVFNSLEKNRPGKGYLCVKHGSPSAFFRLFLSLLWMLCMYQIEI